MYDLTRVPGGHLISSCHDRQPSCCLLHTAVYQSNNGSRECVYSCSKVFRASAASFVRHTATRRAVVFNAELLKNAVQKPITSDP